MELNNAIHFIEEKDNFLLSTHINPDGDGIGSILGLAGLLKRLNKKYSIIFHDPPQEKLSFMERINEVQVYDESMTRAALYDFAIIIDVPHLERIGDVARLLKKDAQILNIDHHVSNERYGTSNLIEPSASSSAEIIGSIFERMGAELDHASAEAIYIGICVDTGRFRFSNTTAEVFRLAEKLLRAGVMPDQISDKIYFNTNLETTIALGKMLSNIKLQSGGKVATSYLDSEFLNSEIGKKVDTEGFVNHPLAINGVEMAFLIQEPVKGKTRVSLRTKTDFDVNKLAGVFGGGGHAKASGCRIEGSVQEVIEKLVEAANKQLGS